ncbi:hypothetical protein [Lapillicoccus jejuensis]|uniref:YtkA-like protein n=1 Tax=Lapillicoccus jejuensis TaxID=402171 RepID=A0A542E2W1_9MICO|nr:hypothetical protein [Lapillicoccus jejuensis]TQJ09670.1 hypothetical protein FB458_2783 [Lapillicoccus jejuensis]
MRRAVAVLLVLAAALLGPVVGGALPTASAHALISAVTLSVEAQGPELSVVAEVRYPDHDAVVGESVVGVAYRAADGSTQPLHVSPAPGRPGYYVGTAQLTPGDWQVEMDAVGKTRGLQSVGFTLHATGPATAVASPAPLPATVQLPSAPAAVDGGQRVRPANATSQWLVVLCSAFVVLGAGIPVLLLRRRSSPPDVARA